MGFPYHYALRGSGPQEPSYGVAIRGDVGGGFSG
jgi:hypothetical protein